MLRKFCYIANQKPTTTVYNIKLTLQYDGTDYFGWQIQAKGATIQQELTDAIKTITKEEINLTGAGRTDSGVHALGQVANFKLTFKPDLYRFKHSLNSILSNNVSVLKSEFIDESFNARFDAIRRSYIYLFSKIKSPFYYNYSLYKPKGLDVKQLNWLSEEFLGKKDYSSFCKTISTTENKICHVNEIKWREKGDLFIFYIEADRFLHGMVRTIVGTLLDTIKTGGNRSCIEKIIKEGRREAAGEAVPAKGLFLFKVKY